MEGKKGRKEGRKKGGRKEGGGKEMGEVSKIGGKP